MTDNVHWLSGMRYVCNIPSDLGAVTKLGMRCGKIVAETESGISMIVPNPEHFSDDIQLPSDTEPSNELA